MQSPDFLQLWDTTRISITLINVHVEVANCSNAEHITDDMLKDLPTLKKALEIAEKRGEVTLKITVEEFNKMRHLSGHCVEYRGKTYRIYLITP